MAPALVLRHYRDGAPLACLARDVGIGRFTAYRYADEGTGVLAEQAPDLHQVLDEARGHATSHLVLDGADPDDKADLYRKLGLKLTYEPSEEKVRTEVLFSPHIIGNSRVSEGGDQPLAHAFDLSTSFALDRR
ncbi:hypothetical protein [Murinocardiopsis flavida]|uniref:hypothetical protein n=1 Tax=Murinocardiopsis flavida TaxID=645275 RepID=UPI0011B23FA8